MSAARGDLYLLIVDVTVCKVTPVILHGVESPEKAHNTKACETVCTLPVHNQLVSAESRGTVRERGGGLGREGKE